MLLHDGSQALGPHLEFIDEVFGAAWPDDPLLICAARRSDCHRTVFTNDGRTPATLREAITASCAVPGYFSGIDIGGRTYVDGGVISPTNADVLRREDLDLAVIVSPMTGASWVPSIPNVIRQFCRTALDHEVKTLRRHGIPTVVIEPGPEVQRHMTMNFMDDTSLVEIVRHAFMDTGRQVVADDVLRNLHRRPQRRAAA
jgi:NTE family protein